MILTAAKHVNARLRRPSTNSPNPRFLLPGHKVKVVSKVLGDPVFGNPDWVLTDENEFFSLEGFQPTDEIKSIPFTTTNTNLPKIFKDMSFDTLWKISKGEGINIGIIDTGVAQHPSLQMPVIELNPAQKLSLDRDAHGTTMACMIASYHLESGKVGVAPNIKNIFSYTIPSMADLTPEDLIVALEAMIKAKVQILNMSFSCNTGSFSLNQPSGVSVQERLDQLANSGALIVCATGNNATQLPIFYPALYRNVISVAGFDANGNVYENANLWKGVSVCLPSENYFTDSQFEKSSETSGATALLSGCLACVYPILKQSNKLASLHSAFSRFPIAKPEFGNPIPVPKFETTIFLQSIQT